MSSRTYDTPHSHAPVRPASLYRFRAVRLALAVAVLAGTSGCTSVGRWVQQGFQVGPDYCRPPAPVADQWIDYKTPDDASGQPDEDRVQLVNASVQTDWWSVFGHPPLDDLIDNASRQNLTLQTAGMQILEARARLAIARGNLLPQLQQAYGDFVRVNTSGTAANPIPVPDFDIWDAGFNASWELDFWGRFRRAVESEDALLNAEIENYDNVLVILQAEVATAYIQYRTLQRRLELVKENVKLQEKTLKIQEDLKGFGRQGFLPPDACVGLAQENLGDTRSLIPEIETAIRLTGNAICVLLGIPPRDLADDLDREENEKYVGEIPQVPDQIVVGIPAELLRRRPDVRRAERLAAAQSAAIGIAESDFYPRIAITGFIGFESENLADLFDQRSLAGSIGPGFQWNILNYGRIRNNVRANEAQFYQRVLDYQNTVLAANREVEDGIIAFLKERDRLVALDESENGAEVAYEAFAAIRGAGGGDNDLWRIYTEKLLTARQDEIAASRGAIAGNLVSIYKALGGGWQTRITGAGLPLATDPFGDEPPVDELAPPEPVDPVPPANAVPPEPAPAPAELPPVP